MSKHTNLADNHIIISPSVLDVLIYYVFVRYLAKQIEVYQLSVIQMLHGNTSLVQTTLVSMQCCDEVYSFSLCWTICIWVTVTGLQFIFQFIFWVIRLIV